MVKIQEMCNFYISLCGRMVEKKMLREIFEHQRDEVNYETRSFRI
jgi:hypothetical protein